MQVSSKVVRAALFLFAMTLTAFASYPRLASAACTEGTLTWLRLDACCFGPTGNLQKWREAKCTGGVWVPTTKTKCSGNCAT